MPTEAQYRQVRYKLAANDAVLPDAELDPLFEDAALIYTSERSQALWVTLEVIDNLLMQAAKRSDYKQNQSQEWLSQIYPHLDDRRKQVEAALEKAEAGYEAPVRMGSLRKIAPRLVEYPDSYSQPSSIDVSRPTED